MVAILIMVTLLVSGKTSMVNLSHVMQVQELDEGNGSILYMTDGRKLQVREKLDEIATKSFDANVAFRTAVMEKASCLFDE